MPAPLRISLSLEEDITLQELSTANGVPRRTKLRATALRLNASGWNVPKIAVYLHLSPQTVRSWLQRWQNQGLYRLWEVVGRGGKQRWTKADIECVEQWLSQERSYTSRQLCEKLATERQVHLGMKQLSRILKKRGGGGNGSKLVRQQPNSQSTTMLSN